MTKIGLVGEDPNDTRSISNLLAPLLKDKAQCFQLLKNIRGHQLDNARTAVSLKIEVDSKKPDIVIFIRDADCIRTQKNVLNTKVAWYNKLAKGIQASKILLLNIYELEGLILADIDTFNRIYRTAIKFNGDVSMTAEPKELLIEKTRKLNKTYTESHCPEVFAQLDLEIVRNRCSFFNDFIIEINDLIK